MRSILSKHAKDEMRRRQISEALVQSVLSRPEQVVLEKGGRHAYQSRVEFEEGKIFLVRAIVADDVDPAVVVTVYRTSKIEKYWRKP
ncbi:MAG: DUF4258 domain-containing protein [Lentisphaerae bacterium]|nr:DUF4258 domain-containing protein [Lentisphaerota bacterium]